MPIGQSYDRAHFLRACIEMCTISGGDDWAVVYCEGTWGVCVCVCMCVCMCVCVSVCVCVCVRGHVVLHR